MTGTEGECWNGEGDDDMTVRREQGGGTNEKGG